MRLREPQTFESERTIIERQVQHLVRLVDDLLDVSRITRGRIALRRRPVAIGEVIAKAVEIASPLFETRAQKLEVRLPRTRLAVEGDAARLAQALSNLMSNAAKYTEPGGRIDISAARERRDRPASSSSTTTSMPRRCWPRACAQWATWRRWRTTARAAFWRRALSAPRWRCSTSGCR
jgi:signal transduction histidine kinase